MYHILATGVFSSERIILAKTYTFISENKSKESDTP